MHSLQEVQQRARAPCLRIARVHAVSSVFVRKFGNSCPCVILDMLSRPQKYLVQMVQRLAFLLVNRQWEAEIFVLKLPTSSLAPIIEK